MAVAANFASIGVLFYTASFAVLEAGVIAMVLGWQLKEYFDKERMDKAELWLEEANRRRREGETTKPKPR